MRYLIGIALFTLLFSSPAFAKQACGRWLELADALEPSKFFKMAKEAGRAKGVERSGRKVGEVVLQLDTYEQARNLAYQFPAFKKVGANFSDYSKLERFAVTMDSSAFKGKPVGWSQKLDNGGSARIRFDWDPEKGAHFNVELSKIPSPANPSVKETYSAAISFLCNGAKCTEAQALKLAEQLGK